MKTPSSNPQALLQALKLNQAANRYAFLRKQALAKVVANVQAR